MSLKYEINHAAGVPQTIVSGFAPRGLVWHWTAGAVGRAGALGTIQHFINTRTTVNASYAILFWHEHQASLACITVAMEIVPLNRASHSMAPTQTFVPKTGSAREVARFAEVHRILTRDSDPNADVISASFCGMPADLAAAVKCPTFVADVRALAARLKAAVPTLDAKPHFGHGWIQPITRYETDITTGGADLLIGPVLYPPTAEEGDDVIIFRNPIVTQTWDTIPNARAFTRPDGTTGFFTSVERVKTVAEFTKNGIDMRLIDYGPNHEALTIQRAGLTNPGTRIVGSPEGADDATMAAAIKAAVDTALAPYKRRIDEFKQLAGKALS